MNDVIGTSGIPTRRISRWQWWIIGIVVLIVILAGVGGAIRGVLAQRSDKKPTYVLIMPIKLPTVSNILAVM